MIRFSRLIRWIAAAVGLLAIVVSGVGLAARSALHSSAQSQEDREAVVRYRTTTCGVERWAIKTGMDRDASRVDTHHVVATTITHLRFMSAPSQPPLTSRVRRTELTVFQIQATLLRTKIENDSDYHLVLADSGGRTMIAEIPSPSCTASRSPFIHQIRYVRSTFSAHFHPGPFWQRGHWPVTITGVGFFDFQHGQSGVAPNAIELHPVLAIKYGSGAALPPPNSKSPTAVPTTSFSVRADFHRALH
ncbi:MAG: hypothetical protein NVS2B16_34700 [Chloroflexota bacterium]